jgi:benzoyl-CoA reductase subunit C
MTERVDCLDGMVFTTICDVARNLSGVWMRNFGGNGYLCELLHMPQRSSDAAATTYLTAEFHRLADRLAKASGQEATPDRLANSIALYNRSRALLRDLHVLRREHPEKVTTSELYVLERLGCVMGRQEHNKLLEEAMAEVRARSPKTRDAVRVLVEGSFCEQPPVEFLEILEEAGCYVVDDDLLVGHRWFDEDIPVDEEDPLRGLAKSYVDHSKMTSVRHQGKVRRSETMIGRMKESRADGVVFCAAKFCEPALYDYVLFKEVLERESVPYLALEFEEKMGAFEQARMQIETFVESIMFA